MIFDCLNNLTIPHLIRTLKYSGRGPLHVGRYDSCQAQPDMSYKLLMLSSDLAPGFPISMGICVPYQCTANQIQIGGNYILQKLQLPLNISSISQNFESYHYPLNFWFFATIFILVAFIVLFLIASCSKSLEKHKILSSFSWKNSKKIFKYQINDLNVLNGIRALAMLWVIMGHDYSVDIAQIQNFLTFQKNQMSRGVLLLVLSALFAVDTFFFIGGFLAAYAVLKQPSTSLLKYPLAILNRYLRIVPAYFVAILIYYGLYIHLGAGPFWAQNQAQIQLCDALWRPLLFVDNLVNNGATMCMGWGWYLQNDMQMFIYCMLILFVYKYDRFSSFIFLYISIVASLAFTMQQVSDNQYKYLTHFQDFQNNAQYQLDIYYKPWSRIPPYLYGLLLGILYYEFLLHKNQPEKYPANILNILKNKFEEKPNFRRIFQMIGVLLGCFICFIPRTAQGDNYWPQFVHSIYLTYGKLFFVFSLSIIILPSILGIQTFIRFIMDTIFFNFIAKISFCTYLIHLTILLHWYTTRAIDSYYAFLPKYFIFASHTSSSLLCGFVLTVLVEIPCSKLQKIVMKNMFTKATKNIKNDQSDIHLKSSQISIRQQSLRINPTVAGTVNTILSEEEKQLK